MKPTAVVSNSTFIEHGLNEIFGQELIELQQGMDPSRMSLLNLRESAFRNLGQPETRGMYVRAGRASFYYWMRQYAESLGWLEVEFRLLPGPVRIKRALMDALKWFGDENFLKADLTSTEEAWLVSVSGLVGEGARLECNTFIGIHPDLVRRRAGGNRGVAGLSDVQSGGAEHCVFEIIKQPAG